MLPVPTGFATDVRALPTERARCLAGQWEPERGGGPHEVQTCCNKGQRRPVHHCPDPSLQAAEPTVSRPLTAQPARLAQAASAPPCRPLLGPPACSHLPAPAQGLAAWPHPRPGVHQGPQHA